MPNTSDTLEGTDRWGERGNGAGRLLGADQGPEDTGTQDFHSGGGQRLPVRVDR